MYRSYYVPLKEFRQYPARFTSKEIGRLCRSQILSKKFMREMKDHLDWNMISQFQDLDEDFMREMKDYIIWSSLIRNNTKVYLSEYFIEEMADYMDWGAISSCRQFSKEFVLRHLDKLDPDRIQDNLKARDLFNSFEEFADLFLKYDRHSFKWDAYNYTDMSFEFVREYKDVIKFEKIVPLFISIGKGTEFVDEFKDYFNEDAWARVESRLYNFDFNFIVKYSDRWKYLKYNNPADNRFRHVKFNEWEIEFLKNLWEQGNKY